MICNFCSVMFGLHSGGWQNIKCTSALLMSVRNARSKYQLYLDDRKRNAEVEAKSASKHKLQEEIQEMTAKRNRLDTDASSMEKEADKLLDKAEHTSQLSMLAKANALRRAAKTKRDDIVKLDAEIVSKQHSVI